MAERIAPSVPSYGRAFPERSDGGTTIMPRPIAFEQRQVDRAGQVVLIQL